MDGTGSGFEGGGARFRGVRRGSLVESSDCLLGAVTWFSSGGVSVEDGMMGEVLVTYQCVVI